MGRYMKKFGFSHSAETRRYSARGGGGLAKRSKVDVAFKYQMPLKSFMKSLDQQERKVLFGTGKRGQGIYRSKGLLGRQAPTEREGKYTPTGRITTYWKKHVEQGQQRPPWKQTGGLAWSVHFIVNTWDGWVVVGPPKLQGRKKTKSTKPLPQLLDTGGKSTQNVLYEVGKARVSVPTKTTYRPFPYRALAQAKITKYMLYILDKNKLK